VEKHWEVLLCVCGWVGRPSVFQVRVRLALRSTVRITEVFVNVYKVIHV